MTKKINYSKSKLFTSNILHTYHISYYFNTTSWATLAHDKLDRTKLLLVLSESVGRALVLNPVIFQFPLHQIQYVIERTSAF
jgi:hypothetical protein